MKEACDKCRWCVARGCNEHEDTTGPYKPPPRLATPMSPTTDTLRAALSDAVKRAGLYEVADAMVSAILDGTFADATEDQVRHAVYELVAKSAITPDPDGAALQGDADAPVKGLDVERLAIALHFSAVRDHNLGEGPLRAICDSVASHYPRAEAIRAALAAATSSADAALKENDHA